MEPVLLGLSSMFFLKPVLIPGAACLAAAAPSAGSALGPHPDSRAHAEPSPSAIPSVRLLKGGPAPGKAPGRDPDPS